MKDSNDFLRVRKVEESLKELEQIGATYDGLYLNKADTHQVFPRLKIMLDTYLNSLDGLKLVTKPISVGTTVEDRRDRKDLERAKNSMELIEALVDILTQQAKINREDSTIRYHTSMAMKQEGIFSPVMIYQLKEDFEAVSLLHTQFKAETNRLVEEGAIATSRNAELRLSLEDTESELKCKDILILQLQLQIEQLKAS